MKLGDLVKAGELVLGDGYRTKRAEYGQPGLPILRVADVADGRLKVKGENFVSEMYRPKMAGRTSQPGDVVLTTKGTVGRVVMIDSNSAEFVYSPQLCYFRVQQGSVLTPRYLYYWFQGEAFRAQALLRKSQTDMADYINLADIRSLTLDVPTLAVQQAVTAILGSLDAKAEVNERVGATAHLLLESTWKSAAAYADVMQIAELGDIRKGLSYKGQYLGSGRHLINLANFGTDGRFRKLQLKRYSGEARSHHLVRVDDLLIANTDLTQRREILGQPLIVSGVPGEALFSHHVYAFRPHEGREDAALWIYGALRDPRFRERAETFASGTTVASLPRDAVLGHDVPWPSNERRRSWSEMARSLLASAWGATEESDRILDLRNVLLPELISGQLRIKDAEKIVEDAT